MSVQLGLKFLLGVNRLRHLLLLGQVSIFVIDYLIGGDLGSLDLVSAHRDIDLGLRLRLLQHLIDLAAILYERLPSVYASLLG